MKHRQTDPFALPLLRYSRVGVGLLAFLLAVTMFFFVFSIFDTDATVSEQENRKLAAKPAFSVSSLMAGEYIPKLESYYSDTFPMRNFFLTVNQGISKVTSRMSFRSDDVVVVQNNQPDDFGGQSLEDVTDSTNTENEG